MLGLYVTAELGNLTFGGIVIATPADEYVIELPSVLYIKIPKIYATFTLPRPA